MNNLHRLLPFYIMIFIAFSMLSTVSLAETKQKACNIVATPQTSKKPLSKVRAKLTKTLNELSNVTSIGTWTRKGLLLDKLEDENPHVIEIIKANYGENTKRTFSSLVDSARRIKPWSHWLSEFRSNLVKTINHEELTDILYQLAKVKTIKSWKIKALRDEKLEDDNVDVMTIIQDQFGEDTRITFSLLLDMATKIKDWNMWRPELTKAVANTLSTEDLTYIFHQLAKIKSIKSWTLIALQENKLEDNNIEVKKVLQETFGENTMLTFSLLVNRSTRIKPWSVWLSDLDSIIASTQLTREIKIQQFQDVIQLRLDASLNINEATILNDKSPESLEIFKKVYGKEMPGITFINEIKSIYTSMHNLFLSLNIKRSQYQVFMNTENLTITLYQLAKLKSIKTWSLKKLLLNKSEDDNPDVITIIKANYGDDTIYKLSTLVNKAVKIKPWSLWLSTLITNDFVNQVTAKIMEGMESIVKEVNTISIVSSSNEFTKNTDNSSAHVQQYLSVIDIEIAHKYFDDLFLQFYTSLKEEEEVSLNRIIFITNSEKDVESLLMNQNISSNEETLKMNKLVELLKNIKQSEELTRLFSTN